MGQALQGGEHGGIMSEIVALRIADPHGEHEALSKIAAQRRVSFQESAVCALLFRAQS